VGELYLGSVMPGLLLSSLYILYVVVRTTLKPELGPPVPVEERLSLKEKLLLVRGLIAPILLVAMVLGLLFAGIATPVEAAGLGSLGAMAVAALHKRLTLKALIAASAETVKATSMVLWIIFGASIFVGLYILQGGQAFITDAILGTGWNSYGILFLMMFLLVILGMFLDWVGILLLAVPIFVPIVQSLTFDGLFGMPGPSPDAVVLWFGVLYLINMQMSFLSPPFGYALFYIRGVAPPEITMATIFRSSLVFLGIQVLALALVVIFPVIATGLPDMVYGR
jgi:tripartite ATP-independent transporter DctM subunit